MDVMKFNAVFLVDCWDQNRFSQPNSVLSFYHSIIEFLKKITYNYIFETSGVPADIFKETYSDLKTGSVPRAEEYVKKGPVLVGGCSWGDCLHHGTSSFEVLTHHGYDVFSVPDIVFNGHPFERITVDSFNNDKEVLQYNKVWKKIDSFFYYTTK